jgi:redox-sensitive bicupin YhaK (pirin superfamily)
MKDQSKGKIFPAAERVHTQSDWFRSFSTFNYVGHQNGHRQPFDSLYVLNEDTLGGGKNVVYNVADETVLIILPLQGAVEYTDSDGRESLVNAGEAQYVRLNQNTSFHFTNPYDDKEVTFLHLWLKVSEGSNGFQQSKPDIRRQSNQLIRLFPCLQPMVWLGRFDGRKETTYPLPHAGSGLFVWVIQGAFEVQYRLLEARDGLAVWNTPEVEIEALSNDAMILAVEI